MVLVKIGEEITFNERIVFKTSLPEPPCGVQQTIAQ
jgi:hypothetical protein